jgi:hypothetical protein
VVAPRPAPPPAPENVSPPSVSGSALVGKKLKTSDGTWLHNPTRFTYKWQRCNLEITWCEEISGATDSTYTVAASDAGYTLVSIVTAWNQAGAASALSALRGKRNGNGNNGVRDR